MLEIENFESSLKETENENFVYDESDVRTILKLYAPEFLDDQFGKILFHQQFEELEDEMRSLIGLERFTLLIEIECKHWISLHVETSKSRSNCACQKKFPSAETNDADLFAYYYDPQQNIDFHLKIKSVLLKLGKVNFSGKKEDQSFVVTQSFLKSLFFSLDYKNEKLDDFSDPHKQPLGFQEFCNQMTSMLKEFKKVKNKIKACSGVFSSAVEDSLRAIPDYKCANWFVLFLECLALEDLGLTNEKLKKYLIKEVIGEVNITIIKELRGMIFHRKESLVFYPQDFKKAFLKPTKDVFQSLSSYLKCVESALEGKGTDCTFLLEGTKHLSVPCEFGIDICEEEVKKFLLEFAEDYLKNYPENLTKQPDKIMFDLTVNFVPLLDLLYKKRKFPFAEIIKFRNEVVHNGFILYISCPNLPSISLQNLFPEFNDFFLKFILCDKFSSILKKISESGRSEDLKTNLESCFETFLKEFPIIIDDLLKDNDLHILDLTGGKASKNNQFTYVVETYLSTVSWIDSKNNISIDKDVKTQHFFLPDNYFLFSDNQRKIILRKMILIKQMHYSLKSSNSKNKGKRITQASFDMFVEDLKNDLTSFGLEESDFRLMCDSLINPGDDQYNKELASIIAGYISEIERKLMLKDRSNASKIIEDFKTFVNKEGKKMPKSKNNSTFASMKGLGETYDIIISDEIVSLSLKHIIQNMLPLLFISPGKAMTWISSIEAVLNDDIFLELLSNETMEKEKVFDYLASVPALVPLAAKWVLDRKLKFSEQQKLQYMKSCIKPLLQPNKTKHLVGLLNFNTKYTSEFCDECLKLVIAKLPDLNFVDLKPLFENENFARNVFKKLDEIDTFVKEEVNQKVQLLMNFLNFKYFKAVEFFRQKQYESALECASRKKGYSKILQALVEKGYVSPDSENIFQMKFLIANINNKIGFTRLNKPDSDSKKHTHDSMEILSHLQESNKTNLFRILKINNLIAFNYHLGGNFECSFNMYVAIMNTLLALNSKRPPKGMLVKEEESGFTSDSLKKLLKSRSYKLLLKKSGRNLSVLNIIYRKGWELSHMAVVASNKNEQKNLLLRAFEQYSKLFLSTKDIFHPNNILVKSSLIRSLVIAKKLLVEFETPTISLKNSRAYKVVTDGKIRRGLWEIKFMMKNLESKLVASDQSTASDMNVESTFMSLHLSKISNKTDR